MESNWNFVYFFIISWITFQINNDDAAMLCVYSTEQNWNSSIFPIFSGFLAYNFGSKPTYTKTGVL